MAEAVVSIVCEGLKEFIVKEVTFLYGVGDQVERAQTELQLMQGYLNDADARQGESEVIRICVSNIRDAAYDLEDVIDTFSLKVVYKRKANRNCLQKFFGILEEGFHLFIIGSEIEKITTKISELRSRLKSYNIREIRGSGVASSFGRQEDLRLTYHHVNEHKVVGLEGDAEILASELVKEGKCQAHRVVSIWGMGGSGKTTLARQVFHHNKVKLHFDCFAWVCVSQECDGRAVLEEVLVKLLSASKEQREELEKKKRDEIAELLYTIQCGKRCLVVLDDFWNADTWNSLKAGFPTNENTESRILLTTRNKEVAFHLDRNAFLHQCQPLNESESWELFEKIALDTDFETYVKEELGKKMVQRCGGLPLAITVLAKLLARKKTVDEWEKVHNNVDVYIRRGTGLEREYKSQEYQGASWVLALSYDQLPYRLKLCFLYLGHFPEDYEIPVKRLTQLWMAEGLISSESAETLEDVSYSCLVELVERSMVQVGKYGSTKKIKTCRLHDLMRDLCLMKAKEQNFLHVVHVSSTLSQAAPFGKARRLAIYLDGEFDEHKLDLTRDERDGRLRSLLYFGTRIWKKKLIQQMFNDFKLLRVLKFEEMGCEVEFPSNIGDLVHLRLLSLKNSEIKQLPSSVANLVCLQTLDLRCNSRVPVKIPNVIQTMEQLRHLYLPFKHRVNQNLSLATLGNLQTLVDISDLNSDLKDLVQLTNLRKLSVQVWSTDLNHLEQILTAASITFNHVQSLCVMSSGETVILRNIVSSCHLVSKLKVMGEMRKLPKDLPSYPNLTKLTLYETRLKQKELKILEKLPKLRMLCLRDGAFMDDLKELYFSGEGFPCLEVLYLTGMPNLLAWTVEKGAMPSLYKLHIEECPKLGAVPDELQYITTLKELTIIWESSEFCSRPREGGEDFYKIQHFRSVIYDSNVNRLNERLLQKKLMIQEKIRVALYVQKCALEFIDVGGRAENSEQDSVPGRQAAVSEVVGSTGASKKYSTGHDG